MGIGVMGSAASDDRTLGTAAMNAPATRTRANRATFRPMLNRERPFAADLGFPSPAGEGLPPQPDVLQLKRDRALPLSR